MDNWNWKKVYFLGFLFSCPAKAQGIGKQHNSNQSLHLLVRSDKAVRLTTACGDVRLRTEEQPTVHEKKIILSMPSGNRREKHLLLRIKKNEY